MADKFDDDTRPTVHPVMNTFNKGIFALLALVAVILIGSIVYFTVVRTHPGAPPSSNGTQTAKPGTP